MKACVGAGERFFVFSLLFLTFIPRGRGKFVLPQGGKLGMLKDNVM